MIDQSFRTATYATKKCSHANLVAIRFGGYFFFYFNILVGLVPKCPCVISHAFLRSVPSVLQKDALEKAKKDNLYESKLE